MNFFGNAGSNTGGYPFGDLGLHVCGQFGRDTMLNLFALGSELTLVVGLKGLAMDFELGLKLSLNLVLEIGPKQDQRTLAFGLQGRFKGLD